MISTQDKTQQILAAEANYLFCLNSFFQLFGCDCYTKTFLNNYPKYDKTLKKRQNSDINECLDIIQPTLFRPASIPRNSSRPCAFNRNQYSYQQGRYHQSTNLFHAAVLWAHTIANAVQVVFYFTQWLFIFSMCSLNNLLIKQNFNLSSPQFMLWRTLLNKNQMFLSKQSYYLREVLRMPRIRNAILIRDANWQTKPSVDISANDYNHISINYYL